MTKNQNNLLDLLEISLGKEVLSYLSEDIVTEITMNDDGYLVLLDVTGTMMLHDSITYDIIPYEFNIKIEETLEKSLKTLDLIEFLWHYIVLEVPLRFTKSEGNYFENERYRVISEEEYSYKNNPFKDFHVE